MGSRSGKRKKKFWWQCPICDAIEETPKLAFGHVYHFHMEWLHSDYPDDSGMKVGQCVCGTRIDFLYGIYSYLKHVTGQYTDARKDLTIIGPKEAKILTAHLNDALNGVVK